jgi:amidase
MTGFTYPFTALGWPALALPLGPGEGGLPASVQLVAPAGQDARVIAAAALLERGLAARPRGAGETSGCRPRP